MADETYTVNASCKNCGWSGTLDVPKGETFIGWGGSRKPCPRCGCQTLQREYRPTLSGGAS